MSDFYCDEVLSGKTQVERVAETARVLAYHHTRPFYPVHIVVIPKLHIPSLVDFTGGDDSLLLELLGVVRDVARHTVTLTMTPAGIAATVDGQDATEAEAVGILNRADRVTVTAETLAPAPIGKARACELHKIMARAGLPSGEHYGFAAAGRLVITLSIRLYSCASSADMNLSRSVSRSICSSERPV